MFFSKACLRRDVEPHKIADLLKGDGYQIHKMVWRLFRDDQIGDRDFIYRYDGMNGLPTFFTVSKRQPEDNGGIWDIQTKPYEPKFSDGEKLTLKLRVNPVVIDKQERSAEEIEIWRTNRESKHYPKKEPTKKRIRHDVVMEAKHQIHYKNLSQEERPLVAEIIQEAGIGWLKDQQAGGGFVIGGSIANPHVRVDGYHQHKLFKGRGEKPISFSTLEFNGILTVTESMTFIEKTLFKGIGPAKGFGCGLMMVRRV